MFKKIHWGLLALLLCLPVHSQAGAFERYLLVFPFHPADTATQQEEWFGTAFRFGIGQAVLSLKTIIFLKDDELHSVQSEYHLGTGEPEPGQMEKIADDKDISLLFGNYQIKGSQITLNCSVIQGRNLEQQTFKVSGTRNELKKLMAQVFENLYSILELTPSEEETKALKAVPGTNSWAAFQVYFQAANQLAANPNSEEQYLSILGNLNKALKIDPDFLSALASRASCYIQLAEIQKKKQDKNLEAAKQDLARCAKVDAFQPLVMNAQIEYCLATKDNERARELGETNLARHPANYANYLLLGEACRVLNQFDAAEKVLVQGLDQQGTDFQKKPFNRALGLLLLKRNDKHAEIYLREVLRLEPKNILLSYLRASALFRLKRYMDVMSEIQKIEATKTWREEEVLKSETALALGRMFFEETDYDRAYSYASIALNIQPNNFDILMLLSKTLRKKGLDSEARKQLDLAQKWVRQDHVKDHLWLGTEFVAQGFKAEGAKEYIMYLKLNPKAPERRRLISLIRKLQGESDE